MLLLVLVRLTAPNFFWRITSPILIGATNLSNANRAAVIGFRQSSNLSEENASLAADNVALQNENLALRTRLEGTESYRESSIVAGVVARPPVSAYDTLVLGLGTSGGVIVGMEAFGPGETPIGLVTQSSANFSRVQLFSAPNVETEGWAGDSKVPVTLRGVGGGAFTISVARAAGVQVGDSIFVPGPGMLPIGVVSSIYDDPSSTSVILNVVARVNIFSLGWVELRNSGMGNVDKTLQ